MLSEAVPPSVRDELVVPKVGLEDGVVMVAVGVVVSGALTAVPVTSRESESPAAEKLTFTLAVTALVGANRTVTVWMAPNPASVKTLPDTTLKGAEVDTVPEMAPPRVFDTLKVCVATLPMVTLPNATVPVGLTPYPVCATALAAGEQALSLPLVSTRRHRHVICGAGA
jgi:hypothetical protein